MREINKIAESLFEKIRDRFEDVSLGDENAKATQDPEKARFFNFDYVANDNNHGNITMSLIDEMSLKIYFSKNISHNMEDQDKKEWYSFLRELREFAKRNLLSFEPRDITRSTLKHRDLQQVSKADSTYDKDEVVSESRMYGTMNRSYEDFGPVRIKVAHAKPIMDETHGARARNIEALFVENDQGERFRMPFQSLIGTRAMARHISAGGTPTDEFGQHICEMVEEMLTLRPFIHSMRHRTFEDTGTNEMLESAFEYHGLLKNTLKKMKGKKGYNEYKESYKPALVENEFDETELREKFVKKVFPSKLEAALPIVHKAYTIMKENNNPFAQQFEDWASTVAEGTWAVPDTGDEVGKLIELFSQPLPVGVDGQNATNVLYNIIGDDRLFDRIEELAETDPEADARDLVADWLQDNLPQVYQQIENEIGDPDIPAEPAEQEIDESVDSLVGKVTELLKRFEENAMEIGAYGDPDINEIMKHLKNGDSEAAAEVVWYSYSDQDGGEVPQIEPYVDDLQAEFEELTGKETTNEGEWQEDDVEAIQSAIIRRILHNINDHSELLMKAGPDGVMNAARDVASFHAPMEEIGSSDVSIMVREVYREVGVEYPETNEAKDTVKYDPKTGKLTGWEHEGDWKKQTTKKDPVGKIHHMSDVARRRTEKMAQSDTLEEAFERALGEEYDTRDAYELDDPKHPDFVKNYEEYKSTHPTAKLADFINYLRSQKVSEEEITMPDNPDYSKYDKPTFQRNNPKELPKKSGWTGYNTDEPAYKRKADYEQEREQLKKLAGVK